MPESLVPALIRLLSCLLVGICFYFAWRWPRRRGDHPHCRHCEYDLFGRELGVCPECGRSLTPQAIVQGARIRKPWQRWAAWGAFALAGAAAAEFGYRAIHSPLWIRVRPFEASLRDLSDPESNACVKSLQDLQDRAHRKAITREQAGVLADICMTIQADESCLANPSAIYCMGELLADDLLDEQRRSKFLNNLVRIELRCPEIVRTGYDFTAAIMQYPPKQPFWLDMHSAGFQFGDRFFPLENSTWRVVSSKNNPRLRNSIDKPGRCEIRMEVTPRLGTWPRPPENALAVQPEKRVLAGTIEALDSPDFDLRLAAALDDFVRIERVTVRGENQMLLHVVLTRNLATRVKINATLKSGLETIKVEEIDAPPLCKGETDVPAMWKKGKLPDHFQVEADLECDEVVEHRGQSQLLKKHLRFEKVPVIRKKRPESA